MTPELVLGLIALVTSFVTGTVGAGGAILFIPLAIYVGPVLNGAALEAHVITGSSTVQSVAAISSAAFHYAHRGAVDRATLVLVGPALAMGALAGSITSAVVPTDFLFLLYGAVALVAAATLVQRIPGTRAVVPLALLVGLAVLVGAIGGALGVGAGFLIIPLLAYVGGLDERRAFGTGLVAPLFLVLPALLGKAISGQLLWSTVPFVAVAAVVGGTLGGRLHAYVPTRVARLALAVITVLAAISVLSEII
jgi:uncharacterized membrane protein YfcA